METVRCRLPRTISPTTGTREVRALTPCLPTCNCLPTKFYWAACELYITTGDKTYYDELMKYGTNAYGTDNAKALEISTTLVGGENNGSFSLFTWGTLNSVGSISLYVNSQDMLDKGLLTQDEVNTLKAQVLKAADSVLEVQNKSAYGIPYVGHDYDTTVWKYNAASGTGDSETKTLSGGYEWGSNSMVINNSMALALAYDASKDVKYIDGVTTAMDYLMGRNPLEQGYVTGYGEHSTKYPHHRFWSAARRSLLSDPGNILHQNDNHRILASDNSR